MRRTVANLFIVSPKVIDSLPIIDYITEQIINNGIACRKVTDFAREREDQPSIANLTAEDDAALNGFFMYQRMSHFLNLNSRSRNVIVTDTPLLLLALVAQNGQDLQFIMNRFNGYDNYNYLIISDKPSVEEYNTENIFTALFDKCGVPYQIISNTQEGIDEIISEIVREMLKEPEYEDDDEYFSM